MAKPVFLTPSAQEDLDKVLSYLSENWGKSVLENFLALYEANTDTESVIVQSGLD